MKKTTLFLITLLFHVVCIAQDNKQDEKVKKANAHYNKGIEYAQAGTYYDAIAEFNEVLRINPKDIGALTNRATCRYNIGDSIGSCEDWHTIKNLDNHSADQLIKKHCAAKEKANKQNNLYLRGAIGYGF